MAESDEIKVLFYTQAANFNVGKVREVLSLDSRIQLDLGFDAIKTIGLSVAATKKLNYIRLPANREEFNKYDIIILGDCLLDNMTNEQINGLYDFVVKRGGGLIFLPGRGEYGPADWKNPMIKPLMPVIFDKENPKFWPPKPNQIELTLEGENGGIIDFSNVSEFDAQVSAFYNIASVKPAASTLATSKGSPLISLHRIGRGKVCLLNISQLFLLYREDLRGGPLYKIISGLISYLSSSSCPSSGIELFVERSGDRQDKIKYSAFVCDSSFSPVEQANVLLNVKDNVLSMNPTGKGYYTAEVDEKQTDTIIATVQAEIGGVFLGEKSIAVNLPPRKNEMTDTEFNEHFLQDLAQQTNALYIHEDKIDRDIVKIFDAHTYMGQSKRITSSWPRWPLLITLCFILFLEWFLRRAKGLV